MECVFLNDNDETSVAVDNLLHMSRILTSFSPS